VALRWISHDPIGIGNGLNSFEYVHSNPISIFDPTETCTVRVEVSKVRRSVVGSIDGINYIANPPLTNKSAVGYKVKSYGYQAKVGQKMHVNLLERPRDKDWKPSRSGQL
jgi:uncharacterized protein RhaS with RHS repeats